jgi:hypothetical protein
VRVPLARSALAALALILLGSASARGDRVALRDGTTMDGTVTIDLAAKTLVVASTKGGVQVRDKVPFSKALAVEAADRKLTWLGDGVGLVEVSGVLWNAAERDQYLAWADRALKAGDGPRAKVLLDAAERHGATGLALTARRMKAGSVKPVPGSAEAVKAIDAEVAEFPKVHAALLWSRLEPGFAAMPEAQQIEGANAVLSLDPSHGPASAYFKSLVPEEFRGKFTWQEWAAWKRVLGKGATLHYPPPLGTPAKGMTVVEKELARAASLWKKDVVGVVRDGLVVIARPPASAGLERVSSTAAAVLGYLDEFFRTEAPRHKEVEPVIVWVHRDKDDLWSHLSPLEERWADSHLRQLNGKKRERAAFFAPDEGLMKVLSPDAPAAAEKEAELRQDIAYFATYDWLYARCPRFRWTETQETETAPAFWIVTDFVASLCNGAPDPATGAWVLPNRNGTSFKNWKVLIEAQQTIPWADVLDGTGAGYLAMLKDLEKQGEQGSTRLLAWSIEAELAAHYMLYGAEPAMRRKFADHVTAVYLGKAEAMTTRAVYGMDAADLGRKINAWASK